MKTNLRRANPRDGQQTAISNFMSGQSVINVNDNYMVRPLKEDRDSVAMTHIRISLKTKAMLDRLKDERGYKTTEELMKALLSNQIQAKPTKEDLIRATRKHKAIDKVIRSLAAKYK